jgi:hypothetical protein
MRHRGEESQPSQAVTSETGTTSTLDQGSGTPPVVPTQKRPGGKHKAPVRPVIPRQKARERATSETIEPKEAEGLAAVTVPVPSGPVPAAEAMGAPEADAPTVVVPHTARWTASHAPRVFAGVLLVLAVGGTSALALKYQQDPGSDQLISFAIGIAVVVGLWAMLIASTPQVVSLRGSLLTIHNSSGTEQFDLGNGLQPVDLLGDPGSSSWALVLHRSNRTSLVLRRRDVDAVQLDPIVRHYRVMAHRKRVEREVRFNR